MGRQDILPNAAVWGLVIVAGLALGGCSTVGDVWDSTTGAVGGLFSSDEDELAADSQAGYPDLNDVPEGAPQGSTEAERQDAAEGLAADRSQAQYTDQVRRRDPVAVRPLAQTESVPETAEEPPPPAPAPVTPVREANRERQSLAERLGAAPPPPPPESASSAAPPPPPPQVPGVASSATSSPVPSSPPPSAPASAAEFPSGGPVVIGGDSSADGGSTQLAALPNSLASHNPASYRVSSHVATINFSAGSARLSGSDRAILDDVVKLRTEYGGALRVIGHASSRTQNLDPMKHKLVNFQISLSRANAVASALIDKGVPAETLFVGAVSDNEPLYYEVMPSGETGNQRTEIYLDY